MKPIRELLLKIDTNVNIAATSSNFQTWVRYSLLHLQKKYVAKQNQVFFLSVSAKVLIACSSTKTKTKTKAKTKAFVCSCMFWNKPVTNKPTILCNIILRTWFVCHRHYLEGTKTFLLGFIFVFVLAHEQAINTALEIFNWLQNLTTFLYRQKH